MESIINELLNQIGLINEKLSFGVLHSYVEGHKHSYWLVIEINDLNRIVEKQTEYFNLAKAVANNEWFDKNVSMLILHKVENFENIQNLVIEIEENPYLFKKQIILYKEIEVEKLSQVIELQQSTLKDFIEDKILEENSFKNHKENINNNDYESLLYRMAYKIPFIKLNIKKENGLEKLNDKNTKRIDNGSLKELNNCINDNFFNRSRDTIDQMESDSLYNLLLKTLNSDEN